MQGVLPMIVVARVLLMSSVLVMTGIIVLYEVTAPANLAWLNGVR